MGQGRDKRTSSARNSGDSRTASRMASASSSIARSRSRRGCVCERRTNQHQKMSAGVEGGIQRSAARTDNGKKAGRHTQARPAASGQQRTSQRRQRGKASSDPHLQVGEVPFQVEVAALSEVQQHGLPVGPLVQHLGRTQLRGLTSAPSEWR